MKSYNQIGLGNQSGFTLIQVLVSASVATVLMLSFLSMANMQNRQAKLVDFQAELANFRNTAMLILGDSLSCKVSFGNSGYRLNMASLPNNQFPLLPGDGIYYLKRDASGTVFRGDPLISVAGAPNARGAIGRTANGKLEFTQAEFNSFRPATSTNQVLGNLSFTVQKYSDSDDANVKAYGAKSKTFDFTLKFDVDASGTIQGCSLHNDTTVTVHSPFYYLDTPRTLYQGGPMNLANHSSSHYLESHPNEAWRSIEIRNQLNQYVGRDESREIYALVEVQFVHSFSRTQRAGYRAGNMGLDCEPNNLISDNTGILFRDRENEIVPVLSAKKRYLSGFTIDSNQLGGGGIRINNIDFQCRDYNLVSSRLKLKVDPASPVIPIRFEQEEALAEISNHGYSLNAKVKLVGFENP